jgi:hypothetical protein
MNRFVKTALALVAAGSAVNAGTGDNEWLELDSEISGLASSLKPSQDGSGWAALIRAVYSHSSDDIATGGAGQPDTSGFNFNDIDLAFWGNQGPYMWRVSADIEGNEAGLVGDTELDVNDAYVKWNCGGYFDAMMGNFKPHVSRSNSVDPEHLLFIDRSALGSSFDSWDNGIGASGTWEQLWWGLAMMNASNGHTRDHAYFLRGEWNLGSGAGMYDGAMGSSDTLNGTVGLTFINDDSIGDITGDNDSDNTAWLIDFHGNVSNVGFGAEVAKFDDDFLSTTDEDFSNIFSPLPFLILADDSTPWNVMVSYLASPELEFGFRYETLDNDEVLGVAGPDNKLMTVVANWYRSGNAGKWQAQWTDIDADTGSPDGSIIEIGYTIGATR